MPATWVGFLSRENPLEKGMTTYSNILAWRIPWTKEPFTVHGGSKRVEHDWVINTTPHRHRITWESFTTTAAWLPPKTFLFNWYYVSPGQSYISSPGDANPANFENHCSGSSKFSHFVSYSSKLVCEQTASAPLQTYRISLPLPKSRSGS